MATMGVKTLPLLDELEELLDGPDVQAIMMVKNKRAIKTVKYLAIFI
jgi:hypothetical protein